MTDILLTVIAKITIDLTASMSDITVVVQNIGPNTSDNNN